MSEPTLYRIDQNEWDVYTEAWFDDLFDELVAVGALVPMEPDPALYPYNADNECATETALKGGTNHCVRPNGHEGMHLAFTFWGAEIGGDDAG